MSESTVRCWLVKREFGDRNIVTIVYATPDGTQYQRRERSSTALQTGSPVTAAADIPESDLEAVSDDEIRERYATEATRTANQYDPDEPI
ncbi:hypothetical protein D8Y22_22135 [Salinadaptatus halalkaliphilus]|uniref:DUF7967 domain-containing protein n=1 Tax=Salinadaptatus halalkaliphilus TaxID=2419781 RepID=A0A4S3TJM4_9EURY|nr:hypothetical protein [Salinadaptatus halalkaliphilus]THE62788.1 hypothetical protein D8Y22_22135 [Salinadaptatus halalkaliphilus]